MIVMGERLMERFAQHMISNACFEPTKKARFSVVMLTCEKERVAVVWFANVLI